MPKDPAQRATLADIIKEKLTEKQTELQTIFSGNIDAYFLISRCRNKYLNVAPKYSGTLMC